MHAMISMYSTSLWIRAFTMNEYKKLHVKYPFWNAQHVNHFFIKHKPVLELCLLSLYASGMVASRPGAVCELRNDIAKATCFNQHSMKCIMSALNAMAITNVFSRNSCNLLNMWVIAIAFNRCNFMHLRKLRWLYIFTNRSSPTKAVKRFCMLATKHIVQTLPQSLVLPLASMLTPVLKVSENRLGTVL